MALITLTHSSLLNIQIHSVYLVHIKEIRNLEMKNIGLTVYLIYLELPLSLCSGFVFPLTVTLALTLGIISSN